MEGKIVFEDAVMSALRERYIITWNRTDAISSHEVLYYLLDKFGDGCHKMIGKTLNKLGFLSESLLIDWKKIRVRTGLRPIP